MEYMKEDYKEDEDEKEEEQGQVGQRCGIDCLDFH